MKWLAISIFAVLASTSSVFGCTYSSSDLPVRHDFSVEVKNGATALEGLTIEVAKISDKKSDSIVASSVTNASGVAGFANLRKGRYYVIIKHPWLRHSIAVKVVSATDPGAHDTISLDWPGNVLTTRDFVGRILAPRKTESAVWDIARPDWQLLSSTVLFVEDAITSQVLRIYKTNDSGEFRLELPPGLYVVRFGQSDKFRIPEGAFAVEVDPASRTLVLNVKLTSMCGGLYAVRADN